MASPSQVLSTEELQRRIYQGICDLRLREWYETDLGFDYLMARLNLRKLEQAPVGPATPAPPPNAAAD